MARRPTMSSDSFNEWVRHPSKAPRPTGVRKTRAANNPYRKTSRVNAFNKMDPLKQKVIVEANAREAYLKGEITYVEARREIVTEDAATAIVSAAAERSEIDSRGREKAPINKATVKKHVAKMTPAQRRKAEGITSYADLMDLIDATRDEDGYSPYFYK